MLANRIEHATQIDQPWPIELQRFDGCAPGSRQPDHQREIVAPGKVLFPALPARVEQWGRQAGHGIERSGARRFALVTAITAKRQIFSDGQAAEANWDDVIHRNWIG